MSGKRLKSEGLSLYEWQTRLQGKSIITNRENIPILNSYTPDNMTSKYIKEKWTNPLYIERFLSQLLEWLIHQDKGTTKDREDINKTDIIRNQGNIYQSHNELEFYSDYLGKKYKVEQFDIWQGYCSVGALIHFGWE